MKVQKLLSLIRQSCERYKMIEEGDKIAVGVSGGKDSLTLLYGLKELSRFYPKHFTVTAICVDLGYANTDFTGSEAYCEKLGVELTIIHTQIGKIVMEDRKEHNPCSLCAKLRIGALVDEAVRQGCNVIAYAHHKDDFVETMLMSMIYQGQFYAFPPVTHLDRTDLTVIRPLMLVSEADVKGFQNKYQLPVCKNPCPMDGHTNREAIKNLIRSINAEAPGVRERLFHAVSYGNLPGWENPDKYK
mgnify:CR=1 FL=1